MDLSNSVSNGAGGNVNNAGAAQPLAVKPIDDTDLLDEIDEIILRRLANLENDGIQQVQLKRWVNYYGRVYDLVYAKLLGREPDGVAGPAFSEEVYEFLAESFWAKIESIYDPDLDIGEQQANQIIGKTRAKLERIEIALFSN